MEASREEIIRKVTEDMIGGMKNNLQKCQDRNNRRITG